MKLIDFYAMNEARSKSFTLEPSGNGKGRLLAWEEVRYSGPGAEEADAEDDISYQVVSQGDIDHLVMTLKALARLPIEQEEEVRNLYARAEEQGDEAVVYDERTGADITTKSGKGDREADDDGGSYEDDNPNSFF